MDSITYAPNPRPVPLGGQSWLEGNHTPAIDAKIKNYNLPASVNVSPANESKDVKKRKLRNKLKKWWQKASKEVGGTTPNKTTDIICQEIACAINAAKCPTQDYAALIGEAIRRSPTRTRSTTGICKDIMDNHDWYRSNRKSGWQEVIAKELTGNPSFQPVVECRKGVIVKNKSLKWQLKRQTDAYSPTSTVPSSTFRPRSPSGLPAPVAELPAMPTSAAKSTTEIGHGATEKLKGAYEVDRPLSTSAPSISPLGAEKAPFPLQEIGYSLTGKPKGLDGVDRSLSTSTPSLSPLSVGTASSPPHYSAIQSASSETGSLMSGRKGSPASFLPFSEKLEPSPSDPKRTWSRISSWMRESSPDPSYRPSLAETLSQVEADSSLTNSTPSDIHGNRRIQLFDAPIEEDSYFKRAQQDANGNSSSPSSTRQNQNTTTASSPDSTAALPFTSRNQGSDKPDENDGCSEDEDDNQGRKRKRFRSPTRNQNRRKFACVYHKFDPATYGVQNRRYLVCAGTGFEYISELVRHLRRSHTEHICGKCLRNYESEELHRAHSQECTVRLRCSQEERWAALWRARFPGVPMPQDPYLENPERPPLPVINTDIEIDSPSEPRESGPGTSFGDFTTNTSPTTFTGNSSPSTTARLQGDCPTPSSSNGPVNGFGHNVTDGFKLMENRVDSLEKRLPLLEEMLGFMLKLMVSTETGKANADGVTAPQISLTAPDTFKHKANTAAQTFLSPASAKDPSYLASGSGTAAMQIPQGCSEMVTNEMLEGDTLTPGLEKFVNEILEGGALSPDLEMSDVPQKTTNSNSLDKANNSFPELMDLSSKELDFLLGNGRHHGGPSSQMDLLLDVQT